MYNSNETVNRVEKQLSVHNCSKSDLCKAVGIHRNTINAESKFGLSAKILSDIADYLNCSVDYLLGRTDVVTVADGEQLTPDEKALLGYFRQLTAKEQQRLIGRAETLAEQESEAS